MATTSMLVRFGLIGYGAWGSHHARTLAKTPGAELTAICARSEETRAKARSDHPTVRVYADFAELLAREELDAVDVVLPSHLHYPVLAPSWNPAGTSSWKSPWP